MPKPNEINQQDRIKKVKRILKNNISASSFDSRCTEIWGIDESARKIDKCYSQLFPQPLIEPEPPYCVCCEYMRVCSGDPQKIDYCPDPKYREWLKGSIPQPLDDEKLREKIAIKVHNFKYPINKWEHASGATKISCFKIADQILPLLQQREQAAEKRGIDSGIKAYESTCESLIVEAVEKESERMYVWLKKLRGASASNDAFCEHLFGAIRNHYKLQSLKGAGK